MKKTWLMGAMVALCAASAVGCGGDDPTPAVVPKLRVSINGWGPNGDGQVSFVEGLPAYEDATVVVAKITDPERNVVLEEESGSLSERAIKIPEIDFAQGLRLDLEVKDLLGDVVATGSTPLFTFDEDTKAQSLRMFVSPVNEFIPAGSLLLDSSSGERVFEQSRLDYRAVRAGGSVNWLGRVGHVAVPTSDGKVLVVGGADIIPGTAPGNIPNFRSVYSDVQVFDPETGYFTDLSYDEELQKMRPDGADQLGDARAYHTVTPIGDDRFIVAGGYTTLAEITRPVRTLELINLRAEPGKRITPLADSTGTPIQVSAPRGFHQAVFLEDTLQILMIGGIGDSSEDIRDDIEIIDLQNQRVLPDRFSLQTARTDHVAIGLGDGNVWVLGGRNGEGALASTELIKFTTTGLATESGPKMKEARFKFGAVRIEENRGTRVLVGGGFTSLEGDVSSTYEIGVQGLDDFVSGGAWEFGTPRGGLSMVALPQTGDVLVMGGQDAERGTISVAERLVFNGLTASPPFVLASGDQGQFVAPRYGASFTQMNNGQILVFGGVGEFNSDIVPLDNAEIYNPDDPVGGRD